MPAGTDETAAADIGHRRHMRTRREKNGGEGVQREVKQTDRAEGRREIDEGGAAGRQRWQHLLVSLR